MDSDKTQILINKCKEKQIDRMILIEVNAKWAISNKDKMLRKIKNIGRNVKLIHIDSTDYTIITLNWLPREILNGLWGN